MLMDQAREQKAAQMPPTEQPATPGAPGPEGQAGGFEKPDWRQFTPPDQVDAVERIIAAGVKLMYSPEMRDELKAAVQGDAPPAQKLAENTVGLLLTLDKQSQSGLPVAALFPAAMGLLGEAATVLETAGQAVTQDDYNTAAMQMYVLIGKKLGASDEQLMQGAQGALGQGGQAEPEDAAEPNEPPENTPPDMREDAAEGEAPDAEEQSMRKGFAS